MKKSIFLFAIASLMSLASCSKRQELSPLEEHNTKVQTLIASFDKNSQLNIELPFSDYVIGEETNVMQKLWTQKLLAQVDSLSAQSRVLGVRDMRTRTLFNGGTGLRVYNRSKLANSQWLASHQGTYFTNTDKNALDYYKSAAPNVGRVTAGDLFASNAAVSTPASQLELSITIEDLPIYATYSGNWLELRYYGPITVTNPVTGITSTYQPPTDTGDGLGAFFTILMTPTLENELPGADWGTYYDYAYYVDVPGFDFVTVLTQ